MLAAFLSLVAFAAGVVLTYAFTDAPRRKYLSRFHGLDREEKILATWRSQLDEMARQLNAQSQATNVALARHAESAADLARRTLEFDQRAIPYDNLVTENRLLKTDLRNLTLRLAREQFGQREAERDQSGLSRTLDRLAQSYLAEVRTATRKSLTLAGYPSAKKRMREAFERVRSAGVMVADADEREALNELHQQYERLVRIAVDREEQARIREQMREEQVRQREAEKALAESERADREQRAIEIALERARVAAEDLVARTQSEAGRAITEAREIHEAEVQRLQADLAIAQANAARARALSMAQQTRAGHVYVISNIGSFGADIFKIGMTRRLTPQDRVDELGDASVPFPFDVHMMISTADAPALEHALHRAFHRRRVNKVNPRKEFFRVPLADIVRVVQKNHGEVEYVADPEAADYRSSQNMTEEDMAEVEEAFEEAEREAEERNPGLDDVDE